ncbi:MAG: hypothetical protein ABIZ70_10555 [Gemmatimonadales bacterium]
MTLISAWLWGMPGAKAALFFGGLATLIQLLADRLARRLGVPATVDRLKVYAIGMALRFGGVALIGVAMMLGGEGFSLLGAALGYLGVILPLLYLETRLDR